jgi:hypothetical protein
MLSSDKLIRCVPRFDVKIGMVVRPHANPFREGGESRKRQDLSDSHFRHGQLTSKYPSISTTPRHGMLRSLIHTTKRAMASSEPTRVPIPKNGVDYRGKVVLAPMVRSGELPSRLLALKYGADLVWGAFYNLKATKADTDAGIRSGDDRPCTDRNDSPSQPTHIHNRVFPHAHV